MRQRVLVVDDDPLILKAGARALAAAGCDVTLADTARAALAAMEGRTFDLAILDYFLGRASCGCDLIVPLRAGSPEARIVVVSGLGALPEVACHAYRAGAHLVARKASMDWSSLAKGATEGVVDTTALPDDLEAFKREIIHGTYLVYHRNVSSTARALGITRTSLQRMLRRTQPPDIALLTDE
jgi:ActR/RegA family two-component response regulator